MTKPITDEELLEKIRGLKSFRYHELGCSATYQGKCDCRNSGDLETIMQLAEQYAKAYHLERVERCMPGKIAKDTHFNPPLGGFTTIYANGPAARVWNACIDKMQSALKEES